MICILNFVFVSCLFNLNSLVLICVAAVMHAILLYLYTSFLFSSRRMLNFKFEYFVFFGVISYLKLKLLVLKFDAYRRLSLRCCLIMLTFGIPLAPFNFHRLNKNIQI